jgi:hypothetical protein
LWWPVEGGYFGRALTCERGAEIERGKGCTYPKSVEEHKYGPAEGRGGDGILETGVHKGVYIIAHQLLIASLPALPLPGPATVALVESRVS